MTRTLAIKFKVKTVNAFCQSPSPVDEVIRKLWKGGLPSPTLEIAASPVVPPNALLMHALFETTEQ